MMVSIVLLIFALWQLTPPEQIVPVNPVKPLSVCEVLEDLEKYRGKMIQIRGRWLGPIIDGHECKPLRTGEYVWESGIAIVDPSWPILETPATWRPDQKALDQADQFMRLQALRFNKDVIVTFIGRLDVREGGLMTFRGGDGNLHGAGYGHLGVYPAQLVLVTAKDMISVRK